MTLDEIRVQIDAVDTQMKPLFLERMECAKQVARAKAEMGSDSVFVLERELAIIEKRAADVDPEVYEEYVTFLRHLMSVSRRYQYGILKELQEKVIAEELEKAGLDEDVDHGQVKIGFSCRKEASDLNLFINMIKLNQVGLDQLKLRTEDGVQKVTMVLDGSIKDARMRQLLCQIAKESEGFWIVELR